MSADRIVRRVKIIEMPDNPDGKRWMLAWSAMYQEMYPTAIDAQNAVAKSDRDAIGAGASIVITTIEWEPKTRVGRTVVNAIVPTPTQRKETKR